MPKVSKVGPWRDICYLLLYPRKQNLLPSGVQRKAKKQERQSTFTHLSRSLAPPDPRCMVLTQFLLTVNAGKQWASCHYPCGINFLPWTFSTMDNTPSRCTLCHQESCLGLILSPGVFLDSLPQGVIILWFFTNSASDRPCHFSEIPPPPLVPMYLSQLNTSMNRALHR